MTEKIINSQKTTSPHFLLKLVVCITLGAVIALYYNLYQKWMLEKTPWLAYWKETSHIDECAEVRELDSDTSVIDIYGSMAHCLAKGDYDTAAETFFFAGMYQEFDYGRVADISAHQAAYILGMYSLNTLEDTHTDSELLAERKLISEKIFALSKSPAKVCSVIESIGYPTYHPSYMINHGMGANRQDHNGRGLKNGFDPKKTWDEVFTEYCVK